MNNMFWDLYFKVRESPAPLNIPTPTPGARVKPRLVAQGCSIQVAIVGAVPGTTLEPVWGTYQSQNISQIWHLLCVRLDTTAEWKPYAAASVCHGIWYQRRAQQ